MSATANYYQPRPTFGSIQAGGRLRSSPACSSGEGTSGSGRSRAKGERAGQIPIAQRRQTNSFLHRGAEQCKTEE